MSLAGAVVPNERQGLAMGFSASQTIRVHEWASPRMYMQCIYTQRWVKDLVFFLAQGKVADAV